MKTNNTPEAADMLRRAIETHVAQLYRHAEAYRAQNNREAIRDCLDEIRKFEDLKASL